jgi:phosphatidylglycerophosphatase A
VNRFSRIIATGFYTGYSPFAPGTAGSGLALIVFWLIPGMRGIPLLIVICAAFFVGVWAAGRVEETDGHDASIINIDEMAGMWLALLFLPDGLSWAWTAGAFVFFRVFDVLKPFPIGKSQELPRGWGVMMDDVLAGLAANGSLRMVLWIFYRVIFHAG